jgi:hypothetical protein
LNQGLAHRSWEQGRATDLLKGLNLRHSSAGART